MKKYIFLSIIFISAFCVKPAAQIYPIFGEEKPVTITGLTFDAMEPFISADGNTLFFNSLNAGGNTNLYYATRVDDTTFTYVGLVNGTYNPDPDHLDAVASMDISNNFFWVSLRGYPITMENLHMGQYSSGSVTNISRVYGDFNIQEFNFLTLTGWLIMDAAVSYQGDLLYYCNAKFDLLDPFPMEARVGVASKVNGSTFNKLPNTEQIFANVNNPDYLVYAPQVTQDGLEFYFTRILKGTFNTEICVSVRDNTTDPFSNPVVIHSKNFFVPEAATITTDKEKIYYHQKDQTNVYKIYLRYKTGVSSVEEATAYEKFKIFPNPASELLNIQVPEPQKSFSVDVYSTSGKKVLSSANETVMNINRLIPGIYYLKINQGDRVWQTNFIKTWY